MNVKNQSVKNGTISIRRAIVMYIIVSLFLFFEMMVQVSPSVMAPQLMRDLSIGALGLGVMSGFYFYSYTAMQIPSGILFDKYNPRWIITISILMCAGGSLLFAFTANIWMGSMARLLMGLGSAFAFVSVLVVTADLFPFKYFALMTGFTQMLAALGAMSGQMPISKLVLSLGWRHTMMLLSAIGFILAIVVWSILKYKRSYPTQDEHVESAHRIGNNLKIIMLNPQTWVIALYAFLLWAPMSGFASLWGLPFLMKVQNLHQNSAAFLCSLMWLGLAIASPLLGMMSTFLQKRVFPLAFSATVGAISFGLLLFFKFSSVTLGILLFFAGAACSGQALSFSVVNEVNSHLRKATAIAFNNMAVVISGALFQPIIGLLLQRHQSGLNISVTSFKSALIIILAAYLVAALVAIFMLKESFSSSV